MHEIKVVNMKCGGCEATVKDALGKEGLKDVSVNATTGAISFEGDVEKAKVILEKLGYPEEGNEKAKSLMKKAKSFTSCLIGKTK